MDDNDQDNNAQEEEEKFEYDMLYELHLLFNALQGNKKNRGYFNHRKFILAVKATNALFDNDEHHDSHEFFSWLVDQLHEGAVKSERPDISPEELMFGQAAAIPSIIYDLFKGELNNIVTCVTCETTTKKKESFLHLSLDVEKNTSL